MQEVPTLEFPYGFDERIQFDAEQRGLYYLAIVRLPGGERVQVGFYDPLRIAQDLEREGRRKGSCVAIPGMIVIPNVTREYMESAVQELWRGEFFDHLMRLQPSEHSGADVDTGGDR